MWISSDDICTQWRSQAWARGAKPPKCRLDPTVKHTGQELCTFSNICDRFCSQNLQLLPYWCFAAGSNWSPSVSRPPGLQPPNENFGHLFALTFLVNDKSAIMYCWIVLGLSIARYVQLYASLGGLKRLTKIASGNIIGVFCTFISANIVSWYLHICAFMWLQISSELFTLMYVRMYSSLEKWSIYND